MSSDVQKADANYLRLLRRLYDAGVTLDSGDGRVRQPDLRHGARAL